MKTDPALWSPIRINGWSTFRDRHNPFQPPETGALCLQGRVANDPRRRSGTFVHTSPIVAVDGRLVTTRSGTVYELGEPEADFARWLEQRGTPIDAAQPIRLASKAVESPTPAMQSAERYAQGAGEPFCACGRRWSECDGSRAGCRGVRR